MTGSPTTLDQSQFWRSLHGYLSRHRGQVLVVGLLLVGEVIAELLKPWPMKFVIDYLTSEEGGDPSSRVPVPESVGSSVTAFLVFAGGAILAFALFDAVVTYFGTYWRNRLGSEIGVDVRRSAFSHLQRLGLDFHYTQRSGELTTRIVSDTAHVEGFVSNSLPSLVKVIGTFASMVAIMFWLDWRLALVTTVVIPPVMFVVIVRFVDAIKVRSKEQRATAGSLSALTQETLQSIQVVKAFSREDFTDELFDQENESNRRARMATVVVEGLFTPAVKTMVQLGVVMMLVFGVLRVRAGAMSTGDLWVFLAYFRGIKGPLKELSSGLRQMARTEARWDRIREILRRPSTTDDPSRRPAPELRGGIGLKDVDFGYHGEGSHDAVLRAVNLEIAPGDRVAIVGATGAGKSTLVSLIAGLYEPSAGTVELDGESLRNLQPHTVRSQLAFVLQESILFATTIGRNIGYGRLDATDGEIVAAAKQAHIHDFIVSLPEGYDTLVGERGATLSGGQRQRIAVARAVLRDAPILILDEPVTGLDADTHRQVWGEIRRLMEARTTILITHDPLLAREMDTVYRLRDGRLVAEPPRGPDPVPVVRRPPSLLADRRDEPVRSEEPLPQLAALTTTAPLAPALHDAIHATLLPGWCLAQSTVRSVRNRTYPSGAKRSKSSVLVVYDLTLERADSGQTMQAAVYLRGFLDGRGSRVKSDSSRSLAAIPELDAYAWLFPDDPAMPSLRTIATADTTESVETVPIPEGAIGSKADVVDVTVSPIRYKPEDRCTLDVTVARLHTPPKKLIAKVFSSATRAFELHACAEALWERSSKQTAHFAVPQPLGLDALRSTLWLSRLPGRSLRADEVDESTARLLGSGLASFHRGEPVVGAVRTPGDQLDQTARKARSLAQLFPHLEPKLLDIISHLASTVPTPGSADTCTVHGAFRLRQLLVDGDRIGIVDFDSLAVGDPAEDVIDLLLDLELEEWADGCGPLGAAFLDEYRRAGSDDLTPERLQWYVPVQLLKRAYWLRHAAAVRPDVAAQLVNRVERTHTSIERRAPRIRS